MARLLEELEAAVLITSRGKLPGLRQIAAEPAALPRLLLTDVGSIDELPPDAGGDSEGRMRRRSLLGSLLGHAG